MPGPDPTPPAVAPKRGGPRTYKVFRRRPLAELAAELLENAGHPLTAEQKTALKGSPVVPIPIGTVQARSPETAMQATADELQTDGVQLAACAENSWVEKKGKENIERSYELV